MVKDAGWLYFLRCFYYCFGYFLFGRQVITMLNNKLFDILKWISIVALPALSTFIVVLGKIWGWGDIAPMVAQTITAVAVLLGALLGISTIQYNKGGDPYIVKNRTPKMHTVADANRDATFVFGHFFVEKSILAQLTQAEAPATYYKNCFYAQLLSS